jgi:hypothetical protein
MSDDDVTPALAAKSDQLNAADIAQPIVFRVTKVTVRHGEDQPIAIYHDHDPARPYKPCKTMARLLAKLWGTQANMWVGGLIRVYNDAGVKWGGVAVGGIRINGMSRIRGTQTLQLTATRGKWQAWTVHEIKDDAPAKTAPAKPTPAQAALRYARDQFGIEEGTLTVLVGAGPDDWTADHLATIKTWFQQIKAGEKTVDDLRAAAVGGAE